MLSEGTSARAAASRANGVGAAASRANGAKSRGPKTPEGKARASQNALKHGLCAKKHLLLPDDSRARFAALEAALLDDLSPEGALQTLLAHRLIAAAWRLERADRLELELFCAHDALDAGPGRALIRDGRDARVFPTLVRYRGAAQAEFFRTLRALQAARREATRNDDAGGVEVEERAVVLELARKRATLSAKVDSSGRNATPNEPERRPSGQENGVKATGNEPGRAAMAALPDALEVALSSDARAGADAGRGQGAVHGRDQTNPREPRSRAMGLDARVGEKRLRRGAAAPFSAWVKVYR